MEHNDLELYAKLSRLQWLLQRHHMQTHAKHGPTGDPTRGQGRVLAALRMQPEIATKDLSYLLEIRQQSLNELLNKLEKSGYVVREPSQADHRIMLVKLTKKGEEAERPPKPEYADIFSCLSHEEQGAFGEYLDRVIALLETQLASEAEESAWGGGRWFQGDPRFRQDPPFAPHVHDRRGPHGFGSDVRGTAPQDIPGAERFHPDYDGPIPERHEPRPFGFGGQAPPPPPPPHRRKPPHDPEEDA